MKFIVDIDDNKGLMIFKIYNLITKARKSQIPGTTERKAIRGPLGRTYFDITRRKDDTISVVQARPQKLKWEIMRDKLKKGVVAVTPNGPMKVLEIDGDLIRYQGAKVSDRPKVRKIEEFARTVTEVRRTGRHA